MVRVMFLHPDLGIGGAERLVVDAALALKTKGHKVSFLTNHHNPNHCFKETTDGSFKVQVVGDWLPRNIFGRCYAVCAYLRMFYAALYASFCMSHQEKIDVVFCDQISIGIPILRLARNSPRILFYCHYPDQLLSARGGILKSVYRAPINWLEERTVGMADAALVNSKYTLRIFCETFRRLNVVPDVLYPSLNTEYFNDMQNQFQKEPKKIPNILQNTFVVLDINRYERKKNHALALNSFKLLADALPAAEWKRCRLIIAGGYDNDMLENVEHFRELERLCEKLDLQDNVDFLRSPTDEEKFCLLQSAHCILYTPENEHFGIVPLEGMYMGKPVIALNSGGPTETIVHNSTGFLCDKDFSCIASAMLQLYKDESLRERMGEMGRKRVQQKFSFEAFANKLDSVIFELIELHSKNKKL